jgi:hypothetical protein
MTGTLLVLVLFLACAVASLIGIIASMSRLLRRLGQAGTALYLAGYWKAEGVSAYNADLLWQELRDALGMPAGTATLHGVGDPYYASTKSTAF